MNVLILGSGGREHAISKKISKSKQLSVLFVAPGNAGTSEIATNVSIEINDFEAIAKFCFQEKIDFVFVGSEVPLVNGITDFLNHNEQTKHVCVIGPNKEAAQLEGSKDFSKAFMSRHNIPTAQYSSFTKKTLSQAKAYLKTLKPPFVLKADGLAAGKGVLILEDKNEAEKALEEMLNGKFGKAGKTVVIEEFLHGIELSVFILTDGDNYVILPEAKDYKRIGENDTGLNTGGMGAISPVPFANKTFMEKVENQIIKPTINGLKNENINYQGFIFIGLMNVNAEPKVIEYNVRMGDPETEVVIPRLKTDLLDLFLALKNHTLDKQKIEISTQTAVTVMLVSQGYPEAYEKAKEIKFMSNIPSEIFHAGTLQKGNKLYTNGGRVLAVTSTAENIQKALDRSYQSISFIEFEGKNYRGDIGFDLL